MVLTVNLTIKFFSAFCFKTSGVVIGILGVGE